MTAVAARRGYHGASVAQVIARAGVSRATFYEHFADREACFLEAYRAVAVRYEEELRAAVAGVPPSEHLRAALQALLACVERDLRGARLLVIEALAGGPRVRAEYERTMARAEQGLAALLGASSDSGSALQIPPFAVLGGVSGVLAMRLQRGKTARLALLVDELLAWVAAHRAPGVVWRSDQAWLALGRSFIPQAPFVPQRGVAPPRLQPRGRSRLAPAVAAANHRGRILQATARLVRRKGYAAMTVADIVAEAGIARGAFYGQFRSKQEAFLAAKAAALQQSMGAAAASFAIPNSWSARVWSGLHAMLGYTGENPDLGHMELAETHAAGAVAIQRMFDSQIAYTMFLEEGYRQRPQAQELPHLCSEAIASAGFALMRRQVIRGHAEAMIEILPLSAYIALAPFLGPAQAIAFVDRKVAGEP